ncbi:hypothetical protein [Nocardia transvalensis]|uniref:hypothetical protein n=1 Tax=Nocardia transvalensis TaxID=37333 RepID=UPI0018951074|nr:hypothetical protein [Nocardia transvalensis]MBF6329443.1 hypothetical protein [Nocardia transvalensis]
MARTVEGRHVTYELTALGYSLLEPVRTMCAWAEEHWDELVDAYDPDDGVEVRAGA